MASTFSFFTQALIDTYVIDPPLSDLKKELEKMDKHEDLTDDELEELCQIVMEKNDIEPSDYVGAGHPREIDITCGKLLISIGIHHYYMKEKKEDADGKEFPFKLGTLVKLIEEAKN